MSRNRTLTGLSRTKELSFNRRMVAKLAQKLERPLKNAIANAMHNAIEAGAKGQPLDQVRESHQRALKGILQNAWTECMRIFGERILNSQHLHRYILAHKRKRLNLKSSQDDFNDYMREYINLHAAKKIKGIAETTIKPFLDADLTNYEIAQGLAAKISLMSTFRANLIARTEMHSASNYATKKAVKSLKLSSHVLQAWCSIDDERVRDEHAAMDEQDPIELDESFNVGGEMLEYPGDPAGSGWNTINCRCAVVHEIAED